MNKNLAISLALILTITGCTSNNPVQPAAVSSPTPVSEQTIAPTPTVTPTASPSATPKPVIKKVATVSAQPKQVTKSAIRAEPASIKATAKRAEFDKLPAFHLYYPGRHKVMITLVDGTTPITAQIFPYNKYPVEAVEMNDVAIIKILMTSSFGRGIPTGVSKETIQIREPIEGSSDFFKYPILVSVPVEINLLD
jgi:hypothetical protein